MNIQWYPGHMAKARREVEALVNQVDIVMELLDARLPLSSRNPMMDAIVSDRPRLVILNKCDLADERANTAWLSFFNTQNIRAVTVDARTGVGVKQLPSLALSLVKEKLERLKLKGIRNQIVRAMITGIPNVGKSSLINRFSGRSVAKTGNRPGITKTKQWIKIGRDLQLLDTPGILWPKFDDPLIGKRLAVSGAIKDDILPIDGVALFLLDYLVKRYPYSIEKRYRLDVTMPPNELLEEIGRRRGCIVSGGHVDLEKASHVVLQDFRSGQLGRISLEFPEDWGENTSCDVSK